MSRNPIAEVGRDVQLIDYVNGVVLAYDKHRSRALRYKLVEDGIPSPLGERQIGGLRSSGTRYVLDRPGQGKHVAEEWVAADGDFKEPLLRIEYNLGPNNGLNTLTIKTITSLEPVDQLPEALFRPPGGLEIIEASPGGH